MRRGKKRLIVHKIEDGMDPREVYCSTYQMRNFYAQFADGFFSSLDVMNYIQHHAAVKRMKKGWRILDACCGRGLLLPLIRYHRPTIKEYVGVDISEKNIGEQLRRSGIKKIDDIHSYYPFQVTHIISSVEEMDQHLEPHSFDFIVYTSAIEHMQKEAGWKSLENCFQLLKPGGEMFLSCPNTMGKKDPYDTQYAAHVYEWDIHELREAVRKIGFTIQEEYGLVGKVKDFEAWLSNQDPAMNEWYFKLKTYMPTPWLMAFAPILYPEAASEILLICSKGKRAQTKKPGRIEKKRRTPKGFDL
jgi:2-polyprenyl-3-methyl-5-hydroxy-6-metoxy-1,4-benzoquinol methylase